MNPELEMLGMVLEKRCLDELLSAGLRPDHMGLPAVQQAFKYLIEHRRAHGSLPTLSAFVRQNPGAIPEPFPPDVTPSSFAAELVGLSLQRQAAVQLDNLKGKMLTTPESVQEAINGLRSLLFEHQPNSLTRASSMTQDVATWYEQGKDHRMTGLPYPWDVLNTETRGIQATDFIVLYGRPKSGKTFQLLHILNNMSLNRMGRILFVSFEMSKQQLINRLACIRAKISYGKFNRGELSAEEFQQLEMALDSIHHDEKMGHEMVFCGPAIDAKRRKKAYSLLDVEQAAHDTDAIAVFVDGLLHCADVRTGKRSREWGVISNLSSDTKQLALSLSRPFIVTHQANREGEKETPIDSQRDIANADALGQDADLTLRIMKIRSDRSGGRQLLIQPTGAREFELLGFLVRGDFCEGMDGWAEKILTYKQLVNLVRREVDEDPMANLQKPSNTASLGAGAKAAHALKTGLPEETGKK